ncbi:hypothetical protein IHN57_18880 [Deinococcus sp. 6GRE01]|nr:hypothetical protein [Deinococcus sp. 6GRE01]
MLTDKNPRMGVVGSVLARISCRAETLGVQQTKNPRPNRAGAGQAFQAASTFTPRAHWRTCRLS